MLNEIVFGFYKLHSAFFHSKPKINWMTMVTKNNNYHKLYTFKFTFITQNPKNKIFKILCIKIGDNYLYTITISDRNKIIISKYRTPVKLQRQQ